VRLGSRFLLVVSSTCVAASLTACGLALDAPVGVPATTTTSPSAGAPGAGPVDTSTTSTTAPGASGDAPGTTVPRPFPWCDRLSRAISVGTVEIRADNVGQIVALFEAFRDSLRDIEAQAPPDLASLARALLPDVERSLGGLDDQSPPNEVAAAIAVVTGGHRDEIVSLVYLAATVCGDGGTIDDTITPGLSEAGG
jgi:hypothetical protein